MGIPVKYYSYFFFFIDLNFGADTPKTCADRIDQTEMNTSCVFLWCAKELCNLRKQPHHFDRTLQALTTGTKRTQ